MLTVSKVCTIVSSGSGAKLTLRFRILCLRLASLLAGEELPGVPLFRNACRWLVMEKLELANAKTLHSCRIINLILTELGTTLGSLPSLPAEFIPQLTVAINFYQVSYCQVQVISTADQFPMINFSNILRSS